LVNHRIVVCALPSEKKGIELGRVGHFADAAQQNTRISRGKSTTTLGRPDDCFVARPPTKQSAPRK
jgi:hypothetical protein